MTGEEAGRLVAILNAAYPQQALPTETVEAYTAALSRFDYEEAQTALTKVVMTSRFFPSIAEIAERILHTRLGLPTAVSAWEAVASGTRGRELPSEIRRARDFVGGGYTIRTSERPEILRAQFIKAYEQIVREAIEAEVERSAQAAIDGGARFDDLPEIEA